MYLYIISSHMLLVDSLILVLSNNKKMEWWMKRFDRLRRFFFESNTFYTTVCYWIPTMQHCHYSFIHSFMCSISTKRKKKIPLPQCCCCCPVVVVVVVYKCFKKFTLKIKMKNSFQFSKIYFISIKFSRKTKLKNSILYILFILNFI